MGDFKIAFTPRGFELLQHDGKTFAQQSSAVGNYSDAMDRPGSSALWLTPDAGNDGIQFNREQVAEFARALLRWSDTGSFDETVASW